MAVHGHPLGQGFINFSRSPLSPDVRDHGFLAEVLDGLRQPRKTLPCKYFYDSLGSKLFDAICETPEYYPTRTELAIMDQHAPAMAQRLGPNCQIIEYGSGSSLKTRWLLKQMPRPVEYVPVDISEEHLMECARNLAERFPDIDVRPIATDFTKPFEVPDTTARRVIYFPGSTIGNFTPREANTLLRNMAQQVGTGGAMLIGVDLKKPIPILHEAYNDAAGVTSAFNLNLLARINRELGANFKLNQFRHRAVYDTTLGRVEMHLESLKDQDICLASSVIPFREGETIHTENSHKFTLSEFAKLAEKASFRRVAFWLDANQLFSVQLYEVV
jgi:L-histidine Nalpha-methyltransferase